jgi:hypothetical protein
MLLLEMVHCLAMFCVFVVTMHSTARPQVVDGENTAGFEGFRICNYESRMAVGDGLPALGGEGFQACHGHK